MHEYHLYQDVEFNMKPLHVHYMKSHVTRVNANSEEMVEQW